MAVSKKLADKFALLNSLRAAAGKPALTDWKNSEAELDQRIKDLTPTIRKDQPATDAPAVNLEQAIADAEGKVPVTVLPPAADVQKAAKRKALITKIASDSVKNDTPTTVIDAKAASRQLRKENKAADRAVNKTRAKAPKKATTKVTKQPTSKGASDFSAYLAQIGMTPKIARAKLRRAKIAKVGDRYELTDAVKAALKGDARKK